MLNAFVFSASIHLRSVYYNSTSCLFLLFHLKRVNRQKKREKATNLSLIGQIGIKTHSLPGNYIFKWILNNRYNLTDFSPCLYCTKTVKTVLIQPFPQTKFSNLYFFASRYSVHCLNFQTLTI